MSGRGFSLIELLIVMALMAAFLGLVLPFSAGQSAVMSHGLAQWAAGQQLMALRFKSMAQDQSSEIRAASFLYPEGSTLHINGSGRLGFTGAGTTRFSGTLTSRYLGHAKQISLGIGMGRVNVK